MNDTPTRIVDFPDCPFQQFLEHMNRSNAPEWTWTFIEMASRFGVFHSSPAGTLIARPVNSSIPESDLRAFNDLDLNHAASSGLTKGHDCWHILFASGDPLSFFSLCPYPLEFISWHRNKGSEKLKTYQFQKIKARFHGK